MSIEAQLTTCPSSASTMQAPPLDMAKLLAEIQHNDGTMLVWVENQKGGRVYLGEILLRIQGCSTREQARFCRNGGLKHTLAEQIKRLDETFAAIALEQNKHPPHRIEEATAIGAVVHQIKQTAARDPKAPKRLREWFADSEKFPQRNKSSAEKIAKRLWHGAENKILRDKFCFVVARFSFEKNLLAILTNRHRPRWLARALVNHVTSKTREFDKASPDTRNFVLNICRQHDMAETIGLLWQLAEAKLSHTERKDKPAARLKQALEAQFRFWEMPSKRSFVQEAWASAAPWLKHSATKTRGDKKELSNHLSTLFEKERGKIKVENFQTHLRYSRR